MSDTTTKTTRREILAGTLGIAGAVWLAACDGTDEPDDAGGGGTDAGGGGTDAGADTDAGPLECNSIAFEMGSRHPAGQRHSIDVPLAHVMAATEQTYDIQGDSRHPHTVVVTPADFARIAGGERVEVLSSEDMGFDLHDHLVTLFCSA